MNRTFLRLSAAFVTAALFALAVSFCLSNYYLDEHYRFVANGDTVSAMQSADTAARINPFSTESLMSKASLMQNEGRYREAEEIIQNAIERDPSDYEIRRQLGNLRLNSMKLPSEAVESYRKASDLNPRDTSIRLGLANAYVSAGKLEEAKVQYEELEKIGNLDVSQMYDLGRIYVRTGEPAKGVRTLRQTKRRASNGLQNVTGQQRRQQRGFVSSVNLALADALVVQQRYVEARQIVANSPAEQAATILSLLDSNPEGYRQTVLNSDVY